jgi:hypothetical protein
VIIIGTLGKSSVIDQLVKNKKIDPTPLTGKWETFVIQKVDNPLPNIEKALVIVGSDKRGTIFGIYDLSYNIGVSPWYYWADVPVKKQTNLSITPGVHTKGEPKVKYRGIFINDEAPALSGWSKEKFGGFNHKFYDKVFELILRMKGNYLWPAMWGNAFYDDDSLNAKLANEYGVVIGTSHHEPMMRAHDEWRRYGKGKWNYNTNDSSLREFWRQGIKRMGNNESIVTIGMRGDGDEPMSEGTQIGLLEKIVADQRKIIAEVTKKDPSKTPQMWALYKEVQDYYDKGMRVPEDVMLLLCDDNWGNIRKLPKPGEKQHAGGYGIYYHYDYVGGPRNYKWLNTNQIERVWEQMHLAYDYGAKELWLVNVGDIKPMEFPIEFFLDYAWNPETWPADRLTEYYHIWAEKQFGPKFSKSIAEIIAKYTKYNSRRKPELLAPETYSLSNYNEAERVVADYNKLTEEAEKIYNEISSEYKDAYYQLVLFPVKACANLNELYLVVAKNRLYASQGRAGTNALAEKAKALFNRDQELSDYYNKTLAGGKWSHMMDQTHIGYTYWQQPEKNSSPEVKTIESENKPSMGVSIEGSNAWWPGEKSEAVLPQLTPYEKGGHYLEIFNKGKGGFDYSVETKSKWLKISVPKGKIEEEQRIWIDADWSKVPVGSHKVPVTIKGAGTKVVIYAVVNNFSVAPEFTGFVETDGYVSIEAENFSKAVETSTAKWQIIPNLGRTSSGVTILPTTAASQTPNNNTPHLQYSVYLASAGDVQILTHFSPTLDFNDKGLHYAISIDDETPQVINIITDKSERAWEKSVADNIRIVTSKHKVEKPGAHTVKFWMVDPAVVLQKIVIDTGGLKPSYLGPQQCINKK